MEPTYNTPQPRETNMLATRITECAGALNKNVCKQLRYIRAFDSTRGWQVDGATSCADWLSQHAGMGGNAARERVRVARALLKWKAIDAAFAQGEITYSKVRAMTRVVSAETEALLVQTARVRSGAQFEKFCRALRRENRPERAWEDEFARKRRVRDTSTTRIEIQLTTAKAEKLWLALLQVSDNAVVEDGGVSLTDALVRFAESIVDGRPISPSEKSARTRRAANKHVPSHRARTATRAPTAPPRRKPTPQLPPRVEVAANRLDTKMEREGPPSARE